MQVDSATLKAKFEELEQKAKNKQIDRRSMEYQNTKKAYQQSLEVADKNETYIKDLILPLTSPSNTKTLVDVVKFENKPTYGFITSRLSEQELFVRGLELIATIRGANNNQSLQQCVPTAQEFARLVRENT